jgi:hypothetical protein
MKKLLILLLTTVVLTACCPCHTEYKYSLKVWYKDGRTETFNLKSTKEPSFEGGCLRLEGFATKNVVQYQVLSKVEVEKEE